MYKFDPACEPITPTFRATALSQIDAALHALDAADRDAKLAVHEVRRRCKKLRGLLRLVRPGFAGFAIENAAIRDAAAMLSHLRDADVLQHTVAALAETPGLDAERLRAIAQRLAEAESPPADAAARLDAFRSALITIRGRAESWSLDSGGSGSLIRGLRATYASARRRMAKSARSRQPAQLHDWRKAAKNHGFHIDLLKRTSPEVLNRNLDLVETLATRLGQHHDLAVLGEAIDASPERFGEVSDIEILSKAAVALRAKVEAEAFELGRQIFAEKPRAVARRFRSYWDGAS